MLPQHSYPAEIAGIADVSRRDDAGETDRPRLMKRKPPVPVIKFRNGCGIEECQPMKLNECISGGIVLSINPANPIHHHT
jgi:hypothetical protein